MSKICSRRFFQEQKCVPIFLISFSQIRPVAEKEYIQINQFKKFGQVDTPIWELQGHQLA